MRLFEVKGGLILEYVSKTEDINVTDDEIEAKYQRWQTNAANPCDSRLLHEENSVEDLRGRLLEKDLGLAPENAKLVDAPADAEAEAAPKKKAAAKKKAPAKKKARLQKRKRKNLKPHREILISVFHRNGCK